MEGIDIGMLPPEIQQMLLMQLSDMKNTEPAGEVSTDRLLVLNDEVFALRKKILKSQYEGAVQATDHLIESIENDPKKDSKESALKMAVLSLETTIDDSKKELMQCLLKQKLEARKVVKRGSRNGDDLDMLDAIIAASEEESDYSPIQVQQKRKQKSNPSETNTGFGFGSSRA